MGIGSLRVEAPDQKHRLYVDGGFAQVLGNRLTILTAQAKTVDELDASSADQAMIEARAMRVTDDASASARAFAVRRAQVQLKLAKRK
jgi:F0F1-type ATP synthase epsilon subunit